MAFKFLFDYKTMYYNLREEYESLNESFKHTLNNNENLINKNKELDLLIQSIKRNISIQGAVIDSMSENLRVAGEEKIGLEETIQKFTNDNIRLMSESDYYKQLYEENLKIDTDHIVNELKLNSISEKLILAPINWRTSEYGEWTIEKERKLYTNAIFDRDKVIETLNAKLIPIPPTIDMRDNEIKLLREQIIKLNKENDQLQKTNIDLNISVNQLLTFNTLTRNVPEGVTITENEKTISIKYKTGVGIEFSK